MSLVRPSHRQMERRSSNPSLISWSRKTRQLGALDASPTGTSISTTTFMIPLLAPEQPHMLSIQASEPHTPNLEGERVGVQTSSQAGLLVSLLKGVFFSNWFKLTDDHGHGSHVAGTIIGKSVGVCKAANAVAVKVLTPTNDGTGRSTGAWSWIMAGMAWGKFFMSSKELC
jgi:subtilisin family serine protease